MGVRTLAFRVLVVPPSVGFVVWMFPLNAFRKGLLILETGFRILKQIINFQIPKRNNSLFKSFVHTNDVICI